MSQGQFVQLPPVPQQVGIFDHLVARQTETLVLKEKILSLSGDSFDIKLASTGQPVLRVQGKVMSISDRKGVFDMSNRHLFDICREHMHLHTTFAIKDPQGTKFMEVKSAIQLFGSKATASFQSTLTGKQETLTMKGNWLDTNADIVDETTGAVVARIDRRLLNARDLFFGQQTYAVLVAPGVDMSLIVALCVCLDEKRNEGH